MTSYRTSIRIRISRSIPQTEPVPNFVFWWFAWALLHLRADLPELAAEALNGPPRELSNSVKLDNRVAPRRHSPLASGRSVHTRFHRRASRTRCGWLLVSQSPHRS